ncbi:MAG TPA: 16S rRNA (cytidine(1402)-2'-O)-methyltransferase, partial [Victivallales bacterium]|nr:16S rRNA (cytidine(1402)-2'-O)-methyltransferase [Victivallales bacterium]
LYIIATPIGNISDITLRAIETLRNSQIIAAEDTRHTVQMLNKLGIKKKLLSCRAANEEKVSTEIISKVFEGISISYVCDAGTPCISDPGLKLINTAIEHGIEPLIIPGVSALTFAITASAMPAAKFAFYGFPPVKTGRRLKFIEKIKNEDKAVFLYESPHRISKLLSEINNLIGPDTKIALIREATKIHEECLRGTVQDIIYKTKNKLWKGEIVLAIYPNPKNNSNNQMENNYED